MPTLFCCILNCESESLNSKKRTIFYRLPQNVDRKQMWINKIGDKIKYGSISANSRICNAHFVTGKPNIDSSHVDHVPNIFPWSNTEDKSKSLEAVEQYETKIKDLEQRILTRAFMSTSGSKTCAGLKTEETDEKVSEIDHDSHVSSCALNLSQSHKEVQNVKEEVTTKLSRDLRSAVLVKDPSVTSTDQNDQDHTTLTHNMVQTAEDVNCKSCTCTKSSCLKLYCECFASGNQCSKGCSCFNCRNNLNHKEEREKIMNCYLDKDPHVFSSKIDIQRVGKKHSKGCNCLKSSCLKNYCECFENKVFCSSLCRCRLCYNNEDRTKHNHRDEQKVHPGSLTSDSISIVSENSPKDISRKRKKPLIKSSESFEDVSSNTYAQESFEEVVVYKPQVHSEALISVNDDLNVRIVSSMEIPPVLPQEDDFTEEELALMLKIREQRSIKIERVSPPPVSLSIQTTPLNLVNNSAAMQKVLNAPCTVSLKPSYANSNILVSISNSLAGISADLGEVNLSSDTHSKVDKLSSNDLISLLVTQQLMVSSPTTLLSNYSPVIPINIIPPQRDSSFPVYDNPAVTIPISRSISSVVEAPITCSYPKAKISTEDYVRRHIEAAERAVQADNKRRDGIGIKKGIQKQRIKTDFNSSTQKTSSSVIVNGDILSNNNTQHFSRPQSEDFILVNGGSCPELISPISESFSVPCTFELNDFTQEASFQPKCSPAFSKAVEMMHNLSPVKMKKRSVPKTLSTSLVYNRKWKEKYKALRRSLHNIRIELRSVKVHMRADQSKIRRLEAVLLHMSTELYK